MMLLLLPVIQWRINWISINAPLSKILEPKMSKKIEVTTFASNVRDFALKVQHFKFWCKLAPSKVQITIALRKDLLFLSLSLGAGIHGAWDVSCIPIFEIKFSLFCSHIMCTFDYE